MTELTQEGQRIIEDAAARHAISPEAVRNVMEALLTSGGGMAQFNHPDLGGMGQWSRGGMTMIGDMFNSGLKSRVDALCSELSAVVGRDGVVAQRPLSSQWQYQGGGQYNGDQHLPRSSFFVGNDNWWPSELGMPASSGSQNNMRYACFPERQRLAVDIGGQIAVYDTGLHWISGFSQQQSGSQSVTFTSQLGTVALDSLPLVSGSGSQSTDTQAAPSNVWGSTWASQAAPAPSGAVQSRNTQSGDASGDIFASIERLASLRDKGFISETEFSAKKTELLQRL
jgi:hypothetical protein